MCHSRAKAGRIPRPNYLDSAVIHGSMFAVT